MMAGRERSVKKGRAVPWGSPFFDSGLKRPTGGSWALRPGGMCDVYVPEESKVIYQSKEGKEQKAFDTVQWPCPVK